MGENAHWTHTPVAKTSDVAGGYCYRIILGIPCEEHHQFCSVVEGIEDSCWG